MAYLSNNQKNILSNKNFGFSIGIINLNKIIINKKEILLSKQLVRSAAAVGALIMETRNAESKKDFCSLAWYSSKGVFWTIIY